MRMLIDSVAQLEIRSTETRRSSFAHAIDSRDRRRGGGDGEEGVMLFGAFLLVSLVGRALAALDCCALGFGTTEPSRGNDSTVCVREDEDCCTPYYLDTFVYNDIVRTRLEKYLIQEYETGINVTSSSVENLVNYFEDNFFERDIIYALINSFTHLNTSEKSESIFHSLIESWTKVITKSNCESVGEMLRTMVVSTVESLFKDGESNKCINENMKERINNETLVKVSSLLVQIYNFSVPVMRKWYHFIVSQRGRMTAASSVSSSCLGGFVEAAFCRKCVERTPPLCLETCNALVRGCYSPYYTVLNGQFKELWSDIERLSLAINTTVNTILSSVPNLVDYQQLLVELRSECGADMIREKDGEEEEKEEKTIGIPSSIIERLVDIDGPFQYGEGSMVCDFAVDAMACDEETPFPTTEDCNVTNTTQLKEDEYTTEPALFSTSECECFDGVVFTTDDETGVAFEGSGIEDQGSNPAFRPPLNVDVLESEVQLLQGKLGDPVNDFLSSNDYTALSQNTAEEDYCKEEEGGIERKTPPTGNNSPPLSTSQTMLLPTIATIVTLLFSFL